MQRLSLLILDLGENRISEFSEWITGMVSLQQVLLNHNAIITIPSTIDNLVNLRLLKLEYNSLTTLPWQIVRLEDLAINVNANHLCNVRSTDALFNWLTTHSQNFEWEASQLCIAPITDKYVEPATGTIVYAYENPAPFPDSLFPSVSIKKYIGPYPALSHQEILNAVEITVNRTFVYKFDVAFSVADVDTATYPVSSLDIFYLADNGWESISGEFNPETGNFQTAASRSGVYALVSGRGSENVNHASLFIPARGIAADGRPTVVHTGNGADISFRLSTPSFVRISVFTPDGRKKAVVSDRFAGPGSHMISISLDDPRFLTLASGMYCLRINIGGAYTACFLNVLK